VEDLSQGPLGGAGGHGLLHCGTSGHRGSAFDCAFNEDHILAITQPLCEYRRWQGIDGPLFLGIDTHALSESAFATPLEVLAAHEMEVRIDDREGYTQTPYHLPRHPHL